MFQPATANPKGTQGATRLDLLRTARAAHSKHLPSDLSFTGESVLTLATTPCILGRHPGILLPSRTHPAVPIVLMYRYIISQPHP
ncbi:hypothetical protein BO71DRAFT_127278 [Aspergillus ellipticus CBS 707.79]|uniref:Uncharacterized protein n=1 Tax=Aspergillus ellipticus CBS 707.79 TaxID=1448320 RepID=A0A319CUB5_9EURO|nr:hypothetical protein BO71DRAFT_127278 [Aspergillus ellipticus CBS 707.79]